MPKPTFKLYVQLIFLSGPGWTGVLALLLIALITTTALIRRLRKNRFEVFYYTHHLFICFYAVLLLHGSFCFVKTDHAPYCRGPSTWKYVLVPLTVYAVDRIWRSMAPKADIDRVIMHPGNVLELQFRVDVRGFTSVAAGSHVRLCCPSISMFQWHSFSLTTSKELVSLLTQFTLYLHWSRKNFQC
jgi:hypothetical protein